MNSRIAPTLLLAGLMFAATTARAAPMVSEQGILTDEHGMTLYVFDNDPTGAGKSVCNGPCAANWPPLVANNDDIANGDYSLISRDDGSRQWAYQGKPLYQWVKDTKPGDQTGDGVKGVWHTARP